jgi:lysophospholipase L1-like esterase
MTHGTAARYVRRLVLAGPLVLAILGVLGVIAWSSPAARAEPLASQFSIADGSDWVPSPLVTIGDGGWTPFFKPGVITWDGGSVMGSFGIALPKMFAQQTQALLGRPTSLYVSATPGADLADMIAEAPTEIDARFDPAADANVCVVQGGASDLKGGPDVVAQVFDALRTYCQGRRAAGFQVAVVTLLPRSDISYFNEARNSFNTLVREQWPTFADAVVDIAADPRMGDDGDNLDRTYYRPDQVHPNAEGCAVLAEDTAPVLDALHWQADSLSWRLRNGRGPWTGWLPYAYRSSWQLKPGDGSKTVECEYRSAAQETVTVADSVGVDTVRPTVTTYDGGPLRAGTPVRLAFRVDDAPPCGSTAEVTLELLRGDRVVHSAAYRPLDIGRRHILTFGWHLGKGKYRWQVRARDGAGNPQAAVGRGVLHVD